jgi:hypothetical protein
MSAMKPLPLIRSLFLPVLLLGLSLGAFSAFALEASLLRILIDPNHYHRESVRVTGYLHLEKDEQALYLNEDDCKHAVYANSIWVDATDAMRDKREQLNGRYVVLDGIFDAEDRGEMGAHSGTLKQIKRFDVWSDPQKPAVGR